MKNSTQTTGEIRPVTQINPNFAHRYVDNLNDIGDLTDSIGLMTDRALGVLSLISGRFERNDTIVNHNVIYLALHSVEQELRDIQAYIKAFSEKEKEQ